MLSTGLARRGNHGLATWDVFHSDRLEVERSLTVEQVRAAVARGDLTLDDLARPAGSATPWMPIAERPELAPPAPDPARLPPGQPPTPIPAPRQTGLAPPQTVPPAALGSALTTPDETSEGPTSATTKPDAARPLAPAEPSFDAGYHLAESDHPTDPATEQEGGPVGWREPEGDWEEFADDEPENVPLPEDDSEFLEVIADEDAPPAESIPEADVPPLYAELEPDLGPLDLTLDREDAVNLGGDEQVTRIGVLGEEPAEEVPYLDPQDEDEEAAEFTLSRTGPARVEELDLAAMVDVAFQMVLFFMVTAATVLYKTLAVPNTPPENPPAAVAQGEQKQTLEDLMKNDYILVEINPQGEIRIDHEPVTPEMLVERLRTARRDTGRKGMLLAADFATPHRNAVLAYDAANELGLSIAIAKPAAPIAGG